MSASSLPLYPFSLHQLDAGEQHRGPTSSSIFYLPANNPGQQQEQQQQRQRQPRPGPSSLPEKWCKQGRERKGGEGGRGPREEEEEEKEGGGKEGVNLAWEVSVCMQEKKKEKEREMEKKQRG